MTDLSELLSVIQALEIQLHQPEHRLDANRVEELLHKDFEEVSRSGQCYNKSQTIAALKTEVNPPRIFSEHFALTIITTQTVLLRYQSYQLDAEGKMTRRTERSSIWLLSPSDKGYDRWQMRFHQGTAMD